MISKSSRCSFVATEPATSFALPPNYYHTTEPCGRTDIALIDDDGTPICHLHLSEWSNQQRAKRELISREYVTRSDGGAA